MERECGSKGTGPGIPYRYLVTRLTSVSLVYYTNDLLKSFIHIWVLAYFGSGFIKN